VGYQDDLNWYAYVGNNPINFIDPAGLAALSGTAFAYTPVGFGSGTQVAQVQLLLPLLGIGLAANEIATSDVPMIGGGFISKAESAVAGLASRATALQGALDPIAAARRTTAVLETTGGTRIVAAGGRDLSPAQRAALSPGEVAAKSPGAHAEVTSSVGCELPPS
jgi:hypothetical protein